MKNKLLTLEKAPFLTIAVFSYSAAIKYFEDLREAVLNNAAFEHAFNFFVLFLFSGTLFIGLYIGFIIAERNISKNAEKNKRIRN